MFKLLNQQLDYYRNIIFFLSFAIRNDAIKRALPDRFVEGIVTCKNSNVADVFGAQVHFVVVVVVGDVVVTTVV